MKNIIIICLIVNFSFISVSSYTYALEREQDQLYDFVKTSDVVIDSSQEAERTMPSFFTYFWRIATAPLVVMFTFPFDEETNIYNTYLEYVNKGTERKWRKKEHDIQKKGFVDIENESDDEQSGDQTQE